MREVNSKKEWLSVKLDIRDIKIRLQSNINVEFEGHPVRGYNMHGKLIERTIFHQLL